MSKRGSFFSRSHSIYTPQEKLRMSRLRKSISGMIDREKELLHVSWTRVYGLTDSQRKASGIKLLSWLLDHVPDMRARIVLNQSEQCDDPPVLCRWFIHLSIAVPNTIDDMIRHLKDPTEFNNYLGNIARYHIDLEPPVTVQNFKDFEMMFPIYVQALLELQSTSEEILLWKRLFNLLTRRVQQECVAAGLDVKPKRGCCNIM